MKIVLIMIFWLILSFTALAQADWTYIKYKDLPLPGMSFCIQSDFAGNIYIGTSCGMMKYSNDKWSKLYFDASDSMNAENKYNIRKIIPFLNEIWAGTNEGLLKISNDSIRRYNLSSTPKMYDDKIRGIAVDKSGDVWFINLALGIFKLNSEADSVNYFPIPNNSPMPFSENIPMFSDSSLSLWYSCNGKLVKFQDKEIIILTESEIPDLKNDTVCSIQLFNNKILVLMKRNLGIISINGNSIYYQKINVLSSLLDTNEHFYSIKTDNEGNIWILSRIGDKTSTSSKYFYKYNSISWAKYEFPLFEGMSQNLYNFSDFTIDENGKVWFAEPYFGLFVFDSKATSLENKNEDNNFKITPNPASDYLEISYPPSREWAGGVSIFDILGMKTTTPSLRDTPPYQGGEIIRLDVSRLSPGVYFLRVGNIVNKFVKL